MQKHGVARFVQSYIKADMGDACGIIGPNEKHQVARLRIGYPRGNVVKALGSQPPGIAKAAVGQNIADKAATIKRGGRTAAAPE